MHDRDQYENPSGFNYGYINRVNNWRTIMSYATNCSCPRINNFSNPDVLHDGEVTGVANSMDNARMLRSKMVSVSNLRNRVGASGPSLAVEKIGRGQVVSDVAGILCGTDCSESFAAGTSRSITLTAIPDSGWTFAGWSGACAGASACRVTVDSARQVSARFSNTRFLSLIPHRHGRGPGAGAGGEHRALRPLLRRIRRPVPLEPVAQVRDLPLHRGRLLRRRRSRRRAGREGIRPGPAVAEHGRRPSRPGRGAAGMRMAGDALELDLERADVLEIRWLSPEGRILWRSTGLYPAGRSAARPGRPLARGMVLVEVRGLGSGVTRRVPVR